MIKQNPRRCIPSDRPDPGHCGATVSLTAIVFSTIGLHQAHLCKTCKKGEEFK